MPLLLVIESCPIDVYLDYGITSESLMYQNKLVSSEIAEKQVIVQRKEIESAK